MKSAYNINRRGLPAGCDPYSLIQDEAHAYIQPKPSAYQSFGFSNRFSKAVNRWFKCEHFYSWIDRPYFQSSHFKKLLQALELENAKLTNFEWSIVR